MKWSYIYILMFLLFSCTDFTKPGQLENIDSVLSELKELKKTNRELQDSVMTSTLKEMTILNEDLKKYYLGDTVDTVLAIDLDAYKKGYLKLVEVNQAVEKIEENLIKLEKSARELKDDVEHSSGKRAEYDASISFEKSKGSQLAIVVADRVENKIEAMETFHNLHEKLREYVNGLMEKSKEQLLFEN